MVYSGSSVIAPAVGYDPRAGEYVASASETGVYGQRIATDGTLIGDPGTIADLVGSRQELAAGAYGGQAHLVAWQDNSSGNWVIRGRQYGALVADFSATPLSGGLPLTVTFSDGSTPEGMVDSYEWNFGDEVTSTISNPVHVYTATGIYTVSLAVSGDDESDILTRTNYITVTSGGSYTTTTTVITYTYDPLNRLTVAEYSDGDADEYEYDEVGNRQALTTTEGTITYT